MIYVGIDVGKDKRDCHILLETGEVLMDNFSFPNTKEGFALFSEKLSKAKGKGRTKSRSDLNTRSMISKTFSII